MQIYTYIHQLQGYIYYLCSVLKIRMVSHLPTPFTFTLCSSVLPEKNPFTVNQCFGRFLNRCALHFNRGPLEDKSQHVFREGFLVPGQKSLQVEVLQTTVTYMQA